MDVAGGGCLGRVEVRVGVDPEQAGPAGGLNNTEDGADRDGVIPTEEDRKDPGRDQAYGLPGNLFADAADRVDAVRVLAFLHRLGNRGLDVAEICHRIAKV